MDPITLKLNTLPKLLEQYKKVDNHSSKSFSSKRHLQDRTTSIENLLHLKTTDEDSTPNDADKLNIEPYDLSRMNIISVDSDNSKIDELLQIMCSASPGFEFDRPILLNMQQLENLGSVCMGWKVLVESSDGNYVGNICWMLDHCKRLGLQEVCRPDSGLKRVGAVLLFYRCVHSITLLSKGVIAARNKQRTNVMEERRGHSLLMKKVVAPHLIDKRREEAAALMSDEEDQEEDVLPLFPAPLIDGVTRPNEWKVVDNIDDHYFDAIKDISSQKLVGVNGLGYKLGRWGNLAWLCIATSNTVYMFDIATLGVYNALQGIKQTPKTNKKRNRDVDIDKENDPVNAENTESVPEIKADIVDKQYQTGSNVPNKDEICRNETSNKEEIYCTDELDSSNDVVDMVQYSETEVDAKDINTEKNISKFPIDPKDNLIFAPSIPCGAKMYNNLADILMDSTIEKVMHDSRNLCDFLHHNSQVTLNGICDLQATELYLYMLQHRGDCPAFVPPLSTIVLRYTNLERAHLLYEKLHSMGEDQTLYHERPLSHTTLSRIASSVVFLVELHLTQLNVLTADLKQLTSVHSTAYALKDDITRARVEHHVVPNSVQQLGRRTVLKSVKASDDRWRGDQQAFRR